MFYGTHDDLAALCGAKAGGARPEAPTTPNVREDDMEIISSQWTGQAVIAGGTVTWLDDPAEVQNLVNQGVPVRTFVTESNVRRFLTERGANVDELILEQERAQTLYAAATSQIEGRRSSATSPTADPMPHLLATAVEVQVAVITAAGGLLVAVVAGVFAVIGKRSAGRLEKAIGVPNGHGNVVQMVERILLGQIGQDNRLASLEAGQTQQARDSARLEQAQQDTRTEVARLEGTCHRHRSIDQHPARSHPHMKDLSPGRAPGWQRCRPRPASSPRRGPLEQRPPSPCSPRSRSRSCPYSRAARPPRRPATSPPPSAAWIAWVSPPSHWPPTPIPVPPRARAVLPEILSAPVSNAGPRVVPRRRRPRLSACADDTGTVELGRGPDFDHVQVGAAHRRQLVGIRRLDSVSAPGRGLRHVQPRPRLPPDVSPAVTSLAKVFAHRHPSTVGILRDFDYGHLPPVLQAVSRPCADLAGRWSSEQPDGPELTTGLRKLLEAKDCRARRRRRAARPEARRPPTRPSRSSPARAEGSRAGSPPNDVIDERLPATYFVAGPPSVGVGLTGPPATGSRPLARRPDDRRARAQAAWRAGCGRTARTPTSGSPADDDFPTTAPPSCTKAVHRAVVIDRQPSAPGILRDVSPAHAFDHRWRHRSRLRGVQIRSLKWPKGRPHGVHLRGCGGGGWVSTGSRRPVSTVTSANDPEARSAPMREEEELTTQIVVRVDDDLRRDLSGPMPAGTTAGRWPSRSGITSSAGWQRPER